MENNFEFVDGNEFLEEIIDENDIKSQPKFVQSIDTKVLDMTIDEEKPKLDKNSVIAFVRNSYHKIHYMEEKEEFVVGIHDVTGKIVPIIARKGGSYFTLHRIPEDYEYSLKELKLLQRIKELNDGEKIRREN